MNSSAINGSQEYVPAFRERIASSLFPEQEPDHPDLKDWQKPPQDGIFTTVQTKLGWLDRLRLIVSSRIVMHANIATENVVGRTATNGSFHVAPPKFLQ